MNKSFNCYKLFLFICFLFFPVSIFAMDVTTEIVANAFDARRQAATSEVYGNLFVDLVESETLNADLHYQFGDNRQNLNVAFAKFSQGMFDITVGRQLFAWGSGYNFNPTDIFNAKPLGAAFDPTYIKTGRDAILVTAQVLSNTAIDFIFAPQYNRTSIYDSQNSVTENGQEDLGIRLKTSVFDYDLALSYVSLGTRSFNNNIELGDDLYGLSVKGSLPVLEWGVWLETVKYYHQNKYEIAAGLEYFYENLVFNVEYYKNSWGAEEKNDYDITKLFAGRQLAQDYLIPSLSLVVDEKLTLTGFGFHNFNDKSNVLGGVIDYFYNDDLELICMPFIFVGDSSTEFGMQKDEYGSYGFQLSLKMTF